MLLFEEDPFLGRKGKSLIDRDCGIGGKEMTVAELIEELKNYPPDAKVTTTVGGEVCEEPWLEYNDNYNIVDLGTT